MTILINQNSTLPNLRYHHNAAKNIDVAQHNIEKSAYFKWADTLGL